MRRREQAWREEKTVTCSVESWIRLEKRKGIFMESH